MRKFYEEIKQIITEQYGFRNIETYSQWLADPARTPFRPDAVTAEMVELLSPDNVDNRDFWKVCNEVFEEDPICNGTKGDKEQYARIRRKIIDANRANSMLSKSVGTQGFAELSMDNMGGGKVLEIGPGYGAFKNFVETRYTHIDYFGFDVHPLIRDVALVNADGTIPAEFVDTFRGQFGLVYSSNVFQHLSEMQRRNYVKAARELLTPKGHLVFNILTQRNAKSNGTDGRCYLCHYGQFTPIPTQQEVCDMVMDEGFKIFATSLRSEGLSGIICAKESAFTTS